MGIYISDERVCENIRHIAATSGRSPLDVVSEAVCSAGHVHARKGLVTTTNLLERIEAELLHAPSHTEIDVTSAATDTARTPEVAALS